jgi:ribose-phosphate pyrophosphokinase
MYHAPDAGGVERTRAYSKRLPGTTIAMIDKRRTAANVSEVMHIIGDVSGRDAVIIDDMIDTAGTLCNAAKAILDAGARSVSACATHGVLSGPAIERIEASPLTEVTVTDTIPLSEIYDKADSILAQKLSQVDGVGQVFVGGGAKPAVRAEVNPMLLNKLGVGLDAVRAALKGTKI